MVLKYRSGEEIKKGAHVLCHGTPGQIELVASDPGDPETAWYVQEYGGGIMIIDAVIGRTFISTDALDNDEYVEFVSRAGMSAIESK